MENEVKYTKLRTTARLNYRTACEVSGETLAGSWKRALSSALFQIFTTLSMGTSGAK